MMRVECTFFIHQWMHCAVWRLVASRSAVSAAPTEPQASHFLHIDIPRPFKNLLSDDGHSYFLVCALILPNFPLLMMFDP